MNAFIIKQNKREASLSMKGGGGLKQILAVRIYYYTLFTYV